jgi:hypothetical protein
MTSGILASLITALAGPTKPAPAPTRGKPRGVPPPDNIRKAQSVRMAAVATRCADFDARLLAACAAGPRSAVDLSSALDTNTSRIKRAARRLQAQGLARVVRMAYPGQGLVFGVEVVQ